MTTEKNVELRVAEISREDATSSSPSPDPPLALLNLNRAAHVRNPESERQIREIAYRLYEERGKIDGQDLDDWLEAEAIVRESKKLAA
jgi:DUF2934 family protein